MCVPAIPALMVAGTVLAGAGQIMSGMQAQQTAKYNAAVARQNAAEAAQVGRINEAVTRDEMRRALARQRAAAAHSGIGLATGSALDLGQDSGQQAFVETQAARTQGQAKSRAFEADARLSELEGRSAMMRGTLNAGATFLQGGTQFARYRASKKAGG